MAQSVSGQNPKLPSKEDNLYENNPNRQLITRHSQWTRATESGLRVESELTSLFTKVKPLTFLNLSAGLSLAMGLSHFCSSVQLGKP